MPRFAANLSMLYPDMPFMERFAAARDDGFSGVEYLFPYAYSAHDLAENLEAHHLEQVLFNAPPGDWDAGERGLACLPGRDGEFQESIGKALDYARTLRCPRIHVMAGLLPAGTVRETLYSTYVRRLGWAAEQAAKHSIDVLIEPINTRDIPGYFLNRQDHAHQVLADIGASNLKVQMDLYHCQIVEGDITTKVRRYLPTGNIGHMQVAGVPERHEPDIGEVNYDYVFGVIDELDYKGWIGCEYRPRAGSAKGGTRAGLQWAARYLQPSPSMR